MMSSGILLWAIIGTIASHATNLQLQPRLKENPKLIKFNLKNVGTAQPYVNRIEEYLNRYNSSDLDVFDQSDCFNSNSYGFMSGKPCVVISLSSVEESLTTAESGSVSLFCDGMEDDDKEIIGTIEYIPKDGHFVSVSTHQNQLAMVKFQSLPKNRVVFVECRAHTGSVQPDASSGLGAVNFQIMIEDK